jgi:membrane protease YdiL (CAAX protease family)
VEQGNPENTSFFAGGEILSVTLSFLLIVWVVLPLSDHSKTVAALFASLTFLFMFLSHRAHGESLRDIGWRTDNLKRALLSVAIFTVPAALGLILGGWLLNNFISGFGPHRERYLWAFGGDKLRGAELFWRAAMIFSGLVQQYVVQGFLNRRAQIIWRRGPTSVIVTATIFALLHLPNYWLMAATFLGGAAWAYIYQRTPNLYALALSHLIMTWLLVVTLPASCLRGLRVGFRFFV